MFKKILIGLAIVLAVLAVVVAMQPSEFSVTRSASISAPPETAFAQVNDLHKWNAWSPWAKLDPECKYTFAGPPIGTGASIAWQGNQEVGEGKMTITESRPSERILMNLEFFKPFAGKSATEFTFKPQGDQTLVTWTMSGSKNFAAKAIGLVMNCDKMMGAQFEKGLAQMKAAAEKQPTP